MWAQDPSEVHPAPERAAHGRAELWAPQEHSLLGKEVSKAGLCVVTGRYCDRESGVTTRCECTLCAMTSCTTCLVIFHSEASGIAGQGVCRRLGRGGWLRAQPGCVQPAHLATSTLVVGTALCYPAGCFFKKVRDGGQGSPGKGAPSQEDALIEPKPPMNSLPRDRDISGQGACTCLQRGELQGAYNPRSLLQETWHASTRHLACQHESWG